VGWGIGRLRFGIFCRVGWRKGGTGRNEELEIGLGMMLLLLGRVQVSKFSGKMLNQTRRVYCSNTT
jgi:hypothetical protein